MTTPLRFVGMGFCDDCGNELRPGERLAGLCAPCARGAANEKQHGPTYGLSGDRRTGANVVRRRRARQTKKAGVA
jgi:hypothetical protein